MKYKNEAIDSGEHCPHCDSDLIEQTSICPTVENNIVHLDMICCACNKTWREFYKLFKIGQTEREL